MTMFIFSSCWFCSDPCFIIVNGHCWESFFYPRLWAHENLFSFPSMLDFPTYRLLAPKHERIWIWIGQLTDLVNNIRKGVNYYSHFWHVASVSSFFVKWEHMLNTGWAHELAINKSKLFTFKVERRWIFFSFHIVHHINWCNKKNRDIVSYDTLCHMV